MNTKSTRYCLMFTGLFLSSTITNASIAVTLGQIDDFEDGTVQNWLDGGAGNTVTTNLPDAGPAGAGDNALNVATDLRAVVFNQNQQWSGNWTAANIQSITMDVRSLDNNDLTLWLGISKGMPAAFGNGDTYVTTTSQLVPGDGLWHSIAFPVTRNDFTNIGGIEVEKALEDVTHLRILHSTIQSFLGGFDVSGFQFDNIAAVPEPGCLALLSAGFLSAAWLGRRHRQTQPGYVNKP